MSLKLVKSVLSAAISAAFFAVERLFVAIAPELAISSFSTIVTLSVRLERSLSSLVTVLLMVMIVELIAVIFVLMLLMSLSIVLISYWMSVMSYVMSAMTVTLYCFNS